MVEDRGKRRHVFGGHHALGLGSFFLTKQHAAVTAAVAANRKERRCNVLGYVMFHFLVSVLAELSINLMPLFSQGSLRANVMFAVQIHQNDGQETTA